MMRAASLPIDCYRPIQASHRALAILFFPLLLASAWGCRSAGPARWWPEAADRVIERRGDTYRGFDLSDDGRLDYLQRVRDGYIDRLYFPDQPGGPLREFIRRPATNLRRQPALILLLDGIAYERIAALRARGHFRLFHAPARLVSTFPTLTDVAYDVFFACGPTPGYEAGYFDRARNRLTNGALVYLSGGNERWVRHSDYRIDFVLDALMYLYPKGIFSRELHTARKVLDARLGEGRQHVVLYILATDGLGHMLPTAEVERQLLKLDAWLERIVYDWRGQLEIVALADHGMSATPTKRFRLCDVLRDAGLHVTDRLEETGDVAVPLFGLVDVARIHTFDDETRDRALAAIRDRPEIELAGWREGGAIRLRTAAGEARIRARQRGQQRLYSYDPIAGDPLGLAQHCATLRATGQMDGDGYADAQAWLTATADDDFPCAVPRLWDGMCVDLLERPDIVLSLGAGWFVGSGLFAAFAEMQGTHGGLHHRASVTFAMATAFDLPSPATLRQVYAYISERLGWTPTEPGSRTRGNRDSRVFSEPLLAR